MEESSSLRLCEYKLCCHLIKINWVKLPHRALVQPRGWLSIFPWGRTAPPSLTKQSLVGLHCASLGHMDTAYRGGRGKLSDVQAGLQQSHHLLLKVLHKSAPCSRPTSPSSHVAHENYGQAPRMQICPALAQRALQRAADSAVSGNASSHVPLSSPGRPRLCFPLEVLSPKS